MPDRCAAPEGRAGAYLDRIANLAPDMRRARDDLRSEWSPERVPVTILAGALAQALVDHCERWPPGTAAEAFHLCEQALEKGSVDERAAVATGFLEGLQHADGSGVFDFNVIADLLGPRARAHCAAMDRFWGAATRGL